MAVGRVVAAVDLALRIEVPAGAQAVVRAVPFFVHMEAELAVGRQTVDVGTDESLAGG